MPAAASPTPNTPAASPSARLSPSSPRARSPRLAPSAERSASSDCLPSARTRNRFATLAQAMSITKPTVPSRIHSIGPTSPIASTESGRTFGPMRTSSSIFRVKPGGIGNPSAATGISRPTSAFAWSSVTPGRSRATPWKLKLPKKTVARLNRSGCRIDGVSERKRNDAGSTPMISTDRPLISMVRPTISRAPPNLRVQ